MNELRLLSLRKQLDILGGCGDLTVIVLYLVFNLSKHKFTF